MAEAREETRFRMDDATSERTLPNLMPRVRPLEPRSRYTAVPSSSSTGGHLGTLFSLMSMNGWPTGTRPVARGSFFSPLMLMAFSTRTRAPPSEMFSRTPVMPTPSKRPVRAVSVAPSLGFRRARGCFRRSARSRVSGSSSTATPGRLSRRRALPPTRRLSWMKVSSMVWPLSAMRGPVIWKVTVPAPSSRDWRMAGVSVLRGPARMKGARTRWASSR